MCTNEAPDAGVDHADAGANDPDASSDAGSTIDATPMDVDAAPADALLARDGVLEQSLRSLDATKAGLIPLLLDILDPGGPVLGIEAIRASSMVSALPLGLTGQPA